MLDRLTHVISVGLRALLLVGGLHLATLSGAMAADAIILEVSGDVSSPLALSQADFDALPQTALNAADRSGDSHLYEGVSLAAILEKAGAPVGAAFKGAHAGKYLRAQGRDGYVVIFSLPEFDQQAFLIAGRMDGQALEEGRGPLLIVAPLDRHHSRWVRDLVSLSIVKAE